MNSILNIGGKQQTINPLKTKKHNSFDLTRHSLLEKKCNSTNRFFENIKYFNRTFHENSNDSMVNSW